MSEANPNEEQQSPEKTPDQIRAELAEKVAAQEKLVAEIEEEDRKNPSEGKNLRLLRERDVLRSLRLRSKENPGERVKAKAEYASKAAMSRAIQPKEN